VNLAPHIDLDGQLWSFMRATDREASMSSTTDRHATDEADRREFQALLESWAEAIVANDADRIDSFNEPDWELVTPRAARYPLTASSTWSAAAT
jgi:hypothetical protein